MLVLSRRIGESVVIGDDIVVTILEQRGDIIRVGVDAPRHVQVSRQPLTRVPFMDPRSEIIQPSSPR